MRSHPARREWSLYAEHNPLREYLAILSQRVSSGALRVLDIGCGFDTKTLSRLSGFRVGVDLVSVESFAPSAGVHVSRASGEQLPFSDQAFDIACCRSVLEHVENPGALFKEVHRVLRPGGAFVFVTPNRWDYVSVASSMVPNRWHPTLIQLVTGRKEEKTFPTLYRANTLGTLRTLAKNAGLRVEALGLYRQHPHYLRRNIALYVLGVTFEQLVQRPVPALRPWILGVLQRP
jgi:SAM-dependent methyltransferase